MRKTSIDLEQRHYRLAEEMEENGDADNQSEAIRTAIDAGGKAMGYLNGEKHDTRLRTIARRFADAFALLGIMWIGLTLFVPVEFRLFAIAPFAMSVACLTIDRGLAVVEPHVSNRILGIFRGEKA